MTNEQKTRLSRDWFQIAGETVEIEVIAGLAYGFCSELGSLRILRAYMHFEGTGRATKGSVSKMRQGFAHGKDSWFVSLEVSSDGS